MAERIRLTITVTPEVHSVFSRMAEAAGVSLGKCMGEWLGDTVEGAQFVADKMEQARKAPRLVMREMQAFSRGLVQEVDDVASQLRRDRPAPDAARQAQAGPVAPSPPASNTGGKVPRRRPQ
jgi:hypothetical protein